MGSTTWGRKVVWQSATLQTFEELLAEGENVPVEGWDFPASMVSTGAGSAISPGTPVAGVDWRT